LETKVYTNQSDSIVKDLGQLNFESTPRELPRYSYQPLQEPRNIRIIKVLAAEERIECIIQQIKLSDANYQALSYVWGSDDKPSEAIICSDNGKPIGTLPLTANLKNALSDLWGCTELESKVFWIDQLCIDQEDAQEKCGQVAMMGEIYKSAAKVILYAGPMGEPKEEKVGMGLVRLLHSYFERSYEELHRHLSIRSAAANKRDFGQLPELCLDAAQYRLESSLTGGPRYVDQGWRWLCSVAFGEWTQRLWIVQEQLLNTETIILRGQCLLAWDAIAVIPILFDLSMIPPCYINRFRREARENSHRRRQDIAAAMWEIWWQRRAMSRTISTISTIDKPDAFLLQNMQSYSSLQCRDPRDKIYALLAVSSDAKKLAIVPDYAQPPETVFVQITVRHIQNYEDLRTLAFVCLWANPSDTSFPSWAINMFSRSDDVPVPGNLPFNYFQPHPYSSLCTTPFFNHSLTTLTLKGRVLDRISTPGSPLPVPSGATNSIQSDSLSLTSRIQDTAKLEMSIKTLLSWSSVLLRAGVTPYNIVKLFRACTPNVPNLVPGLTPGLMLQKWPELIFTFGRAGFQNNTSFHRYILGYDTRWALQQICVYFWSIYRKLLHDAHKAATNLNIEIDESDLEVFHKTIRRFSETVTNLVPDDFDTASPLNDAEVKANAEIQGYLLLEGRSFTTTDGDLICSAMRAVDAGDSIVAFQGADRLYIIRPVGDKYRLIGDAFVYSLMEGEAYENLNPYEVDYDISLI
jgi:hypothetical protein